MRRTLARTLAIFCVRAHAKDRSRARGGCCGGSAEGWTGDSFCLARAMRHAASRLLGPARCLKNRSVGQRQVRRYCQPTMCLLMIFRHRVKNIYLEQRVASGARAPAQAKQLRVTDSQRKYPRTRTLGAMPAGAWRCKQSAFHPWCRRALKTKTQTCAKALDISLMALCSPCGSMDMELSASSSSSSAWAWLAWRWRRAAIRAPRACGRAVRANLDRMSISSAQRIAVRAA